MQTSYVKNNITKHIAPKIFCSHEIQKNSEVIQLIYSLSLCLHLVFKYAFIAFEWVGLKSCIVQGE